MCPRDGPSQPYLIFPLEENICLSPHETLRVNNCTCKVRTNSVPVQADKEASDLIKPNGES